MSIVRALYTTNKSELLNNLVFSDKPSDYLNFLRRNNKVCYYSQLNALIGSPQDPNWHQEGDVWNHTLLVVDSAVEFRNQITDEFSIITYMLGALCHDFGKPFTLIFEEGRFRNPAHDIKGVMPTQIFLNQCGFGDEIISKVSTFVKEHLRPIQLYKTKDSIKSNTIQKLSQRVNIKELILIAKADHKGRIANDNSNNEFPHCDWLEAEYNKLCNTRLTSAPLLNGADLIQLNYKPGNIFKSILNHISKLQLSNKISTKEEAIAIVKKLWKPS